MGAKVARHSCLIAAREARARFAGAALLPAEAEWGDLRRRPGHGRLLVLGAVLLFGLAVLARQRLAAPPTEPTASPAVSHTEDSRLACQYAYLETGPAVLRDRLTPGYVELLQAHPTGPTVQLMAEGAGYRHVRLTWLGEVEDWIEGVHSGVPFRIVLIRLPGASDLCAYALPTLFAPAIRRMP